LNAWASGARRTPCSRQEVIGEDAKPGERFSTSLRRVKGLALVPLSKRDQVPLWSHLISTCSSKPTYSQQRMKLVAFPLENDTTVIVEVHEPDGPIRAGAKEKIEQAKEMLEMALGKVLPAIKRVTEQVRYSGLHKT
jgi:hypothetical protein